MDYSFPFTTCEKKLDGVIAQPVSSAINIFTCICLVSLLFITKKKLNIPVVFLIFSLILFESWHAFSHMQHIDGTIQTNVIHALLYLIVFMTAIVIYTETGSVALGLVMFVIIIDLILLSSNKPRLAVISGVCIFGALLFANIHIFPITYIYLLLGLIGLGITAFLLEHSYCKTAMNIIVLPYHAIIEIIILLFIMTFAKMMVDGF